MRDKQEKRNTSSGMTMSLRRGKMSHQGYFLRVPERGVNALTSFVTPDEDLFLLAHMGLAVVEADDWKLKVTGMVERPSSFRLADLGRMPQCEITSVHECAGSPLMPAIPKRRVGNVVWSGVQVSEVLLKCGLDAGAAFVWMHGLDCGNFADLENERYVKDLPLFKALCPEVLLATGMNGKPLAPDRGGPVRLVVPGWYGTNSVKWLGALTVMDHRAPGPYTTRFYNDPSPDGPKPVWGIAPESVIVSPSADSLPLAGEPLLIQGWAWAETGVVAVEITVNAGDTWVPAALEQRVEFGWQRFNLQWTFQAGLHEIRCRCFDAAGTGQPESGARNAVHQCVVQIRANLSS